MLIVSTHSRLKAAGKPKRQEGSFKNVSTHSRLKAAGPKTTKAIGIIYSFNTQPPEGGWVLAILRKGRQLRFQHTAA